MKLKRKKRTQRREAPSLRPIALATSRKLYTAGIGTATIHGNTKPCFPCERVPFSPTRGLASFIKKVVG